MEANVLPLLILMLVVNANCRPWEPYSADMDSDVMKQYKSYHDTFYSAFDVAAPIMKKMFTAKLNEYKEKFNDKPSSAGKAGKYQSSEEDKSTEYVSRLSPPAAKPKSNTIEEPKRSAPAQPSMPAQPEAPQPPIKKAENKPLT